MNEKKLLSEFIFGAIEFVKCLHIRLVACSEVIVLGFKLKSPILGCSAELNAENKDDLLKQGMEHASLMEWPQRLRT